MPDGSLVSRLHDAARRHAGAAPDCTTLNSSTILYLSSDYILLTIVSCASRNDSMAPYSQ
jgi:hypothetical protein